MADITHRNQPHVFIDRKWYRVKPDFSSYLDDIVARFLVDEPEYALAQWPVKSDKLITEDEYIFNVLDGTGELTIFHKDHVSVSSGKAEICDVDDSQGAKPSLVFIKRGITSVSRELARQTVDSISLLLSDMEFQAKAMSKLRGKGVHIPDDYSFFYCSVILAIVDEKERAHEPLLERMRIISKIEFAFALETLRSRVDGPVHLYEIQKTPIDASMAESKAS